MRFFNQTLVEQFRELLERNENSLHLYSYEVLDKYKKAVSSLPMAMNLCCGKDISMDYLKTQGLNLKRNQEAFDLALVTHTALDPSIPFDPSNVLGFIIVQKGECVRFENAYCINLICSPSSNPHAKGIGSILISFYLYCVINNDHVTDKHGLLELANAYVNMGGLCLYSKYGFEYDASLHGKDCFYDHNNLPMVVDMATKYQVHDKTHANQLLKAIAQGTKSGFEKPFVCKVTDRNKQLLLGMLLNINKFLELQVPQYITQYVKSDDAILEYEQLFKTELHGDVGALRSKIKELADPTTGLSPSDLDMLHRVYIPPPPPKVVQPIIMAEPTLGRSTRYSTRPQPTQSLAIGSPVSARPRTARQTSVATSRGRKRNPEDEEPFERSYKRSRRGGRRRHRHTRRSTRRRRTRK